MIDFGILGPLEVRVEGRPVALGGARQRAVLARLLLSPSRVVSSESMIDDVWNGRPPASAAKVLQKYVSGLRKVLPTQAVRTSGRGYVLDIDDDRLDARRFEQLVGVQRYEAALAVWRGDVLSDLPDLAFIAPERARLDELRMFAVESRLEAELAAGRHGEVIGELAELVDAHPLRERLTAARMLALYRAGRQVEALRAFDRHRRHLADEVGVDPALELRELEGAILRHDPGLDLPGGQVRGNLPLRLTSFVGRVDELDAAALAIAENRLVTFTGPGGIGKTRLALELGTRVGDRFRGGVWMVDLASERQPDLVAGAVATALAIDTRHATDKNATVAAALAHRPPSLIVLDNCEHVVEAVAAVVGAILDVAGSVRVLATSRRPLGIDGEFVRPVHPLPDEDAVQLFGDRARLAAAGGPDVSNDQAWEICRQLDGLPLAIELAASQLRVMDPAEIAARLGDQLAFRGRATDPSPRQRTLGDTVRWSFDLLPSEVRRTFARLGVFASTFTLSAAESVCAHGDIAPSDVLGHVTTLVDHSLLVRQHAPSRYRLLETLRLFALDRLAEADELDRARRAHTEYFLALAEEGGPQLYGPHEGEWRSRLEVEEPNLHAALPWAAEHDPVLAMRLAVAVWPYWEARWGERQGVAYIEALLERHGELPDELRAWGLTACAAMGGNAGDARQSTPRGLEAVAAFRRLGDELGLGEALSALGQAFGNQGRLDEADRVLTEGLTIARRLDDAELVSHFLDRMSYIASRRGDYARAAEINREELAAAVAVGSRRGEATALRHLAVSMQHLGANDEAAALCHRALDIWNDLDDPAAAAHVQTTLADIARLGGDLVHAAQLYDTALVDLRAIGDRRCMASTYKNLAAIAAQRDENEQAAALYRDGLVLRHELGDEAGLAEVLEGLAGVASKEGREEDAVTLVAAALALRERTGSAASDSAAVDAGRILDAGRRRLGDEGFRVASELGQRLSVTEVIDFCLAVPI